MAGRRINIEGLDTMGITVEPTRYQKLKFQRERLPIQPLERR